MHAYCRAAPSGGNPLAISPAAAYDECMSDLISTTDAARIIGVDESQVRQYLRRGTLKGRKVSITWLIERRDAERFKRPPMGNPAWIR